MTKKKRCTDVDLGGRISLEIVLAAVAGREPRLTLEDHNHLRDCVCCKESLPHWIEKSRAARKVEQASTIVNLSEAGDKAVLRKYTKGGTALFKPHETNPSMGLFVLIEPDHFIHDPEEMALEDFNRIE